MNDLPELLQRFKRGPELLATLLTGAAGREFDYSPAPDKWSIRQIMAHMVDSEMMGAGRMRRLIAEDNAQMQLWDQNAWATRLDYAKRKPSECLVTFRILRKENYDLLQGLPTEIYERASEHPKRGRMTLYDVLKLYTDHAEKHADQIRSLRDAYREAKARGEI